MELPNHYKFILEHFYHHPKVPTPLPAFPDTHIPSALGNPNLLSVSIRLPFCIFHINEILQFVVLCDWLFHLSIMFSRVVHVVVCNYFFFFILGDCHIYHLSLDGHLCYFLFGYYK